MIHIVTITQVNGRVRMIPVDADDAIDACVRAGRLIPFVAVAWTATAEAQSEEDCIEHVQLFDKLLTAVGAEFGNSCEGNSYVTNEAYIAGINEYIRTINVFTDLREEARRDEKRSLYGCHEDIAN